MRPRRTIHFFCSCFILLFLACGFLSAAESAAEEPAPAKPLQERTIPLRTALHHDPSLGPPFERLVSMYREANRLPELVQMYRTHTQAYPDDTNALAVLIRLLSATGAPEADSLSEDAAARHPDNALLHFLRYEHLKARHAPKAIEALDRAVTLEVLPHRKSGWIDLLLRDAQLQGRRDLAGKHLEQLARSAESHPASALDVARRMIRASFYNEAFALLRKVSSVATDAETTVEIELEAARALQGAGRKDEAAAALDALLEKVTADYWRRPEILRRRLALVTRPESRKAMLDACRKRVDDNPESEAACVDLARVLVGFSRRREALDVLREGGRRIPASRRIEEETLALFDRLCDERGRALYLDERIKQFPGRRDLVDMQVKSLFIVGRTEKAKEVFQKLIEDLPRTEHVDRYLALARYLRTSGLHSESVSYFQKVIEQNPARLDVLRELCETYCALKRRDDAHTLLSKPFPESAGLEDYLDLLQFMIQEKFYMQAKRSLAARLKKHETSLDLRMKLLDIEGRLGNRTAGEALIGESRRLADTGPRYLLWLSTAASFYESFDAVDAFLDAEMARLDEEAQAGGKGIVERHLALVKICEQYKRREDAVPLLQNDLDRALSEKERVALRRKLVSVLRDEKGAEPKKEAEKQLGLLLKEDPGAADTWNLQLALLHADSERLDRARTFIEKVAFDTIRDPQLLHDAEDLLRSKFGGMQCEAVLERLTVIEPTNRNNWEGWISELVFNGKEYTLRTAIRRLLAGVKKLPIADPVQSLLKAHLVNSFWRSVAVEVTSREGGLSESSIEEALVLVDGLERASQDLRQHTIAHWARAFLLNRAGRRKARDEALGELEQIGESIVFPDGLSITFRQAKTILTAPPGEAPPDLSAGSRKGPLPGFSVKWTFDTLTGGYVTRIVPLSEERLLVCDTQGSVFCLDAATGKTVWEKTDALPLIPQMIGQPQRQRIYSPTGGYHYVDIPPVFASTPAPVYDGKERIYLPEGNHIICRNVSDGRIAWKSAPVAGGGLWRLFLYKDRIVGCNAASRYFVSFDRATGKLICERKLIGENRGTVHALNSGAALFDRRLFVYGGGSAFVLDPETGETVYAFEPLRVAEFPLELEEPSGGQLSSFAASPSAYLPPQVVGMYGSSSFSSGSIPPQFGFPPGLVSASSGIAAQAPVTLPHYINYYRRPVDSTSMRNSSRTGASPQHSFVPPAVKWASRTASTPRHNSMFSSICLGTIHERRLLLFSQEPAEALSLSCDLPFAGRIVQGNLGTFLGITGRTACFLNAGTLVTLDILKGTRRELDVGVIGGGKEHPFFQAVLDGPLAYVTGPEGILCINVLTGAPAFQSPWPDGVDYNEFFTTKQNRVYALPGVFSYHQNSFTSCMPLSCCIAGDMLYVLTGPATVTALD